MFVKRPDDYQDASLHTPYDVLSVLHWGPLEGSKDGEAQVFTYLHDHPDSYWYWQDPSDPLSLVDQVKIALAYDCTNSLNNKKLVEYVHLNRNHNYMRIASIGKTLEEMIARQDEEIATLKEKMAEAEEMAEATIVHFNDQFKTEMLEKFEELRKRMSRQEEKIAEQEKTILTQTQKILEQDEKIAQIKKPK